MYPTQPEQRAGSLLPTSTQALDTFGGLAGGVRHSHTNRAVGRGAEIFHSVASKFRRSQPSTDLHNLQISEPKLVASTNRFARSVLGQGPEPASGLVSLRETQVPAHAVRPPLRSERPRPASRRHFDQPRVRSITCEEGQQTHEHARQQYRCPEQPLYTMGMSASKEADTPLEDEEAPLASQQQKTGLDLSDLEEHCKELSKENAQLCVSLQQSSDRFRMLHREYKADREALLGLWRLATIPVPGSETPSVSKIRAEVEQRLMHIHEMPKSLDHLTSGRPLSPVSNICLQGHYRADESSSLPVIDPHQKLFFLDYYKRTLDEELRKSQKVTAENQVLEAQATLANAELRKLTEELSAVRKELQAVEKRGQAAAERARSLEEQLAERFRVDADIDA